METKLWVKLAAEKRYNIWQPCGFKISKGKPPTKSNEVAIRLDLHVPDAYFELPELSARISLPDKNGSESTIVDFQEHISEILTREMGIKIHVSIPTEKEEEPSEENIND